PQWITCISSDDVARTVRHALDAGGKVVMEADRDETGGITLIQDTVGAVFGVFQRDQFGGAHLFNQPISLTFNLLMTRHPASVKQFYTRVFGWEARDRKIGGVALTVFFHGGRGIAGAMAMDEQWALSIPSHWQVSFAVNDADALASHAGELRGEALPVTSTPFGRSGLITDPQGAMFSLSQQTPEVRAAAQTPEGVLTPLI
ncbi:MAG TPA: VOC family protein, partial [Ktedonobacteraceae bacterium]|nr:VOC family protein [Ktedonobacteraceae bacterium]